MGKLFLMELRQENPDCLICRQCETEIVSRQDCSINPAQPGEIYISRGGGAINLLVDEQHEPFGSLRTVQIYCSICTINLGYRYFEVGENPDYGSMCLMVTNLSWKLDDVVEDADLIIPPQQP